MLRITSSPVANKLLSSAQITPLTSVFPESIQMRAITASSVPFVAGVEAASLDLFAKLESPDDVLLFAPLVCCPNVAMLVT